jgi:hypothetical protein
LILGKVSEDPASSLPPSRVTGIETRNAMALEPQVQRRWEEQLAGYARASFRVLSLAQQLGEPGCSSSVSW